MSVISINSYDEYQNVIKSDSSVIHFYAPWAEQCLQMNEVLEQMLKLPEYTNVKLANIVAEDFPKISMECNISAIPTTLLFKNSSVVARIDGANPTEVKDQVKKKLLTSNIGSSNGKNLEDRLKKLINQAPCTLFMKGNRDVPRCGFSKSMIALLNSHKVDYQTYDILEDQEVREGLKKFSDWPTYPQLYINGELIGGLDIVKELSKTGELDSMVPKVVQDLNDRLQKLINQASCMLFMKGNKSNPRCGFSQTIVSLLEASNADYETFDILEDNEVREGLKKYSDWPTYPQLYISGELIGGLDIVNEMIKSGDLDDILPKK